MVPLEDRGGRGKLGGHYTGQSGGEEAQTAVRLELGATEWRAELLQERGRDAQGERVEKEEREAGRDCSLVPGSMPSSLS